MTIQKALAFTREHYEAKPNSHEAAKAKPIDQSMQEDPLEKKYPLESLKGTAHPHHASPVATALQTELLSDDEFFSDETFDECLEEAEKQPPISPLFDVFWGKGELTFLFGSAGIGKSILAVQILDAIAKGAKVQRFDGPQEPMRVGLFDFELSALQHLKRYRDESGNRHKFSPNFFRFGPKAYAKIPKGMKRQDYILEQIEKKIIKRRLEVVVIDNLTALLKRITESEDALEFMDKLVDIKLRYDISMLVIGHTPKRDLSKPLTEDDMSGSKQLINLCDSAFAIGKSMKESNVRYLKQIKARNAEYKYGSENVVTFRVVKNGCYLCFEHIGFDDEKEHLRERSEAEINELNEKIIALHQSEPNLSYSEIAKRLNTSKSKVGRVLKKKQNRGDVDAPEPF
jgi:RecA-family ATPase